MSTRGMLHSHGLNRSCWINYNRWLKPFEVKSDALVFLEPILLAVDRRGSQATIGK